MEFASSTGLVGFFAILFALMLVAEIVFHGLVLQVGTFVVWVLSAGRVKRGVRRTLWKAAPKPKGGAVFYYEGSDCYMYENYVGLIGVATFLLALTVVFGVGMWVHA